MISMTIFSDINGNSNDERMSLDSSLNQCMHPFAKFKTATAIPAPITTTPKLILRSGMEREIETTTMMEK